MRRVFVVLSVLLTCFLGPCPVSGAEDEVPVFPNLAFTALDGSRQLDLESFRGRPVLMTFWASWCGPCRMELPELQKLAVELADEEFVLITINVDEHAVQGARFLQKYDIDVPVYRMDQGTLRTLGLTAVPTNLLLDREGRPVQIYRGYSPEVPNEIRKLVREMEDLPAGSDRQ
ncbi:MAG: TlpA family protein disulfide reductase [Acidobacteria bacterium]|jgi:thiol-disulfide isomerase/thioredoxin|nr:TlpA family protein disulfide reductase [Acidobacteriota bacterium]